MINGAKLYRAQIVAMVVANSDHEAKATLFRELASDNATVTITLADSTPSEWYTAVPFGSEDDKTVGEILRKMHRRNEDD